MDLGQMPKIVGKRKKRAGRGAGSGRGKTAGRGTKGQKAREKVSPGFEGGQTPLTKRLPLTRGTGNRVLAKKPVVVNLKYLNLLSGGTLVTLETLVKKKIVDPVAAANFGVKILGDGEIKIPLKVNLPTSAAAAAKIIASGGQVIRDKIQVSPKKPGKKTAKNEPNS